MKRRKKNSTTQKRKRNENYSGFLSGERDGEDVDLVSLGLREQRGQGLRSRISKAASVSASASPAESEVSRSISSTI